MKLKALTLALLLASGICAQAATPEQMEQARLATIKVCLRNMNNGSDYLERIQPSSLADLESKLKATEKTNIASLKSIQLPAQSEYAAWDKKEFDNYWENTFVNQTGITSKDYCRSGVRSAIQSIPVTAQAAQTAPEQQTEDETANQQEPEQPAEEAAIPEVSETNIEVAEVAVPDPDTVPTEPVATDTPETKKNDSSDTASIVVLCILVVVVVALVGYALNVMKKNKARQSEPSRSSRRKKREYSDYDEDDYRPSAPTVQADPEDESPFAAYSAAPEPQPVSDPRDREIERLRSEIASLQSKINASGTASRPASMQPVRRNTPRVIYLAQANADGVFTRADAHYNMGNSIFKLVTTDGVSGSYSVIEDPTVFELALMMPTDFLINACTGRNLQLSEGARTIINEASGTAIFENGRWHVSRKAQIRYSR